MLESARLLLRPWALSPDPSPRDGPRPAPGWTRIIVDPEGDTWLGCVRVHSRAVFAWFPWLTLPHLDVYESEDLSLLCTLRRGWAAVRWHVLDADSRLVGTIHGSVIYDAIGRRVVVADRDCAGADCRFRTPGGQTLGTLEPRADGICLAFAEDLANDPLGKMLILAGSLAHEAIPGSAGGVSGPQ